MVLPVIPLSEKPIVFIKSGPVYLELFQANGDSPSGPPGGTGPNDPGWRHLAFKVDDGDAKLRERE